MTSTGEPFVTTSVESEHGRWAVIIDVVFPDGAVRHRIATYPTQARARLAARIMQATAERDHRPDWGTS